MQKYCEDEQYKQDECVIDDEISWFKMFREKTGNHDPETCNSEPRGTWARRLGMTKEVIHFQFIQNIMDYVNSPTTTSKRESFLAHSPTTYNSQVVYSCATTDYAQRRAQTQ